MDEPSPLVSSLFESTVNHVVLPPRLPGKEESRLDQIENALINRLLDATCTLRDRANSEFSEKWERIRYALQICKVVNDGGKLDKTSLVTEFRRLKRNDLLILHIAEQNAGLLIRRCHE